MKKKGLRELILDAKSAEEVDKLLAQGQSYVHASDYTRSAWRCAAARRKAFLAGKPDPFKRWQEASHE